MAVDHPRLERSGAHSLGAGILLDAGVFVAAAVGLIALAGGSGGYYPVSWGWTAAGLIWAGALVLLLCERIAISRTAFLTIAGWTAFMGWSAASLAWSIAPSLTALEVERDAVYVAAVIALVLLGRRIPAVALLTAMWAAITVVSSYALVTHLLPDRFGTFVDTLQNGRLYQPFGYWNALGVFAAIGMALALGLAARRATPMLRCAAAASLPVLACTIFFTFSRGAWIAAGCAALLIVIAAPRRLEYLVALLAGLPWVAVALAQSARSHALTAKTVNVSAASSQGSTVLAVVIAACAASAVTVAVLGILQRRLSLPERLGRQLTLALLVAGVAALAAVVALAGGPSGLSHKLHKDFLASNPGTPSQNVATRLDSLSLDTRPLIWRIALRDFDQHPLDGSGAGTFRRYWYAHRTHPYAVLYTHSLYVQVLSELGAVGLVLLLIALGGPVVAALRARGDPLMPAALGAYAVFVIHAAVDWDWQFPAIVLVAIGCAAVMLRLDTSAATVTVGRAGRGLAAAALAALAAVAVVGLLGNRAISAGLSDLGAQNWAGALSAASSAYRWAPWDPQPDVIAAHAEVGLKNRPAALADYRAAIRIDPQYETAWRGVAGLTSGTARAQALAQLNAIDPLTAPPPPLPPAS